MRSIWHSLPAHSLAILLFAIFLTFVPMGFLFDVSRLGTNAYPQLFAYSAFSGFMAVLYFYGLRRKRILLLFAVALNIASLTVFAPLFYAPMREQTGAALRSRMTLDAMSTGLAIGLAYVCFMMFVRREGARYFRAHTEIELAHDIHQLLVPRIAARVGRFEFFGASMPSGEVGGDLVDLVEADGRWIGYIADVSGHGVGSGVLMGMVKSAARMKLLTLASLPSLLDDLNEALVPVRKPGMFVTMACLGYDEGKGLEFSLAGHLPLLHYQAATGTVKEHTIANLPVAMFEATRYRAAPVSCDPGDLFVLITDGLSEVFDAADSQLGLDPIKDVIRRGAALPLNELLDALVTTARSHGAQTDDQTALLMRVG